MTLFKLRFLVLFVSLITISNACKKEEIQIVKIDASFRAVKSSSSARPQTAALLVNCKYYVSRIQAQLSGTGQNPDLQAVLAFLQNWADEVCNRAYDTRALAVSAFNAYNNGAASYAISYGLTFTGTPPTTDPIIEDCDGTYIPPVPGPGPGAVAMPPLPLPADTLGKIMLPTGSNLTATQLEKLKTMLSNFLSGYGNEDWACIHKHLYRYIVTNNWKFNFMMNSSNLVPQSYNPATSTFSFMNDDAFEFTNIFEHEVFHGLQDMFIGTDAYAVGTVSGGYPAGYLNIEFETALFTDIVKGSAWSEAFNGADQALRDEYNDWLDLITVDNTKYPKSFEDLGGKYNYFLKKFKLFSAYAGRGEILLDLKPVSLLQMFTTAPCK